MKYNVHGFYQPRAVELGLTNDDLLVLRWFVDYTGTGKMKTVILENKVYYWVNYSTVLEELPVLKVSKQTLYKKHFMNLVNSKVLEHKHIKEDGSFSYYCYGLNYETLLYLEGGYVKNNDPMSKFTEGVSKNETTPLCQNLTSKDYNTIINNSIILNNKERKKGDYDDIIEQKISSEKVKEVIREFIKFRKMKKSPLTDYALKLFIDKLKKLANNEDEAVKIVQESIMRGWLGIFPLKENKPQFELTEHEKEYAKKLKEIHDKEQAELDAYEFTEHDFENFRKMGYSEEDIQRIKEMK